MSPIPVPHGGTLIDRLATPEVRAELTERARALRHVTLSARTASDIELLAVGGFSPLSGFMGAADYRSVLRHLRLANGLPWPMPITLAVDAATGRALKEGEESALTGEDGSLLALLEVQEVFSYDKREEARLVYRTEDPDHPGVATLYGQGDLLVGGPVTVLRRPRHRDFLAYRLDPVQTRVAFAERRWRSVVGFQTRNPIHRAHEYIQKCALEMADGLLVHPLVGETKSDDIPAEVRVRCYEVLLRDYYPPERTLLALLPAAMRYAGPREAVFHALVRKNYGCSHFIVGRDHAGVGSYYGPFDAHAIFEEFTPEELGITPLFFDATFYCRRCASMASAKTCPHGEGERLTLSGTQVRQMLAEGELPPPEFTRPEVARVLMEAMRGRAGS